eukprot:TRINITY_DN19254_c0_g1_i1.p1 TRINITY_DN19254_c0_g1~~TRINITY_DN19254_c0_g1_i1.p1  ORF type:complete len:391 (+),score=85.01 TRINITY_DN19254_c0_g1_i1:73-1245(+)
MTFAAFRRTSHQLQRSLQAALAKKGSNRIALEGLPRGLRCAHSSAVVRDASVERPRKSAVPLGDLLQKKGRRDDVKSLPDDQGHLRLHVGSIEGMTISEVTELAVMMNMYGAAVLCPEQDLESGLAAYRTLDRLLGTCVSHDQMDERGVVEINPARPTSINVANPKAPHLPHTDDAYTRQPARFITLQCREAAPSGGGESVLVSGVDLLKALNSEELRSLMRPGMVTMGRRPASDGSWMKCSSIPMFWVNSESGWLQLRWRCNDGCVQDVSAEAESAYRRMDAVARSDVHQLIVTLAPKEILIVDNRAVAHGRRSFNENEPRIMWRRNYYGDGELADKLSIGMLSAHSSLFDGLSSVFDCWSSTFDAVPDLPCEPAGGKRPGRPRHRRAN